MSPRMKRMQLYLEPELDEQLGRIAARRHVSKAQLLRDGARTVVSEEDQQGVEDPMMAVIGLGHGGPGRVSEDHDRYLTRPDAGRTAEKRAK